MITTINFPEMVMMAIYLMNVNVNPYYPVKIIYSLEVSKEICETMQTIKMEQYQENKDGIFEIVICNPKSI